MFSKILINKSNLISNIKTLREIGKNKEICVMVKAEAYGHGAKEIVSILNEEINFFGVSNQSEAEEIREVTNKTVIVFGACDDYGKCMEKDISFALFSYYDAKNIIKTAKKKGLTPKFHLCLNTGMNRYGVKNVKELTKIIKLLSKNNLELKGIYTHFSSLTTDENYTQKQKDLFYNYLSYLPKEWKTIKHIGGGRSIFTDINTDMYRVGLECYGYGNEYVKPVMKVESQIVDIQKVYKGEHVGYLCGFTAQEDMTVATIPLGYGDGLPRKLSNKFLVKINGKETKNVGNICMDAFMIDVTNIFCKVGDKVTIMDNASELAPLIESTEYEVLTNFCKFRGNRQIL